MCEKWLLMWTQVSPKEGRDCNTMSTPVFSLWAAHPYAALWELNGENHTQPWVGCDLLMFSCLITFPAPILRGDLVPAIPSEEHCCLAHRLPMEHLKDIASMTDVLCMSERWRERCLGWYNTGYLSIALPDPERACGWGSKLEIACWLLRHRQPPLFITYFLALASPCISGQSLRIWHCPDNSILCWMEKSAWVGHIHPTDWHLCALQDLGSLLLLGGRC